MKQSWFRKFLFVLLGLSAVFSVAAWLLPYEWNPDPAAGFKIAATQVKRDRSYLWVTVHLKKSGDAELDLMKPVRLIEGNVEHEPADTTLGGMAGEGTSEVWYKFWLEDKQLAGPLHLKINDGKLLVKSSKGVPGIADGMMKTFSNHRW